MGGEVFKVTRKYQITIPLKIREKFKIKEGDLVRIHDEGNRIVIEPLKDRSSEPILDMLSLVEEPVSIDAVKLVEDSWDDD